MSILNLREKTLLEEISIVQHRMQTMIDDQHQSEMELEKHNHIEHNRLKTDFETISATKMVLVEQLSLVRASLLEMDQRAKDLEVRLISTRQQCHESLQV